jgi:TRAP-type C4-dicarboxylate transport system permease large subunit
MALLIISFLVLLILGVPVAISMALSSLIFIVADGSNPPFVMMHRMISGVDSFPLLAVPFFIYAGNLMNIAGVTSRIYSFALALVGWLPGGLGHVNVVGSVIFSGMSGSAIAEAAGLGSIQIKAMNERSYPIKFSVGVTAAAATLGPIIPPSIPFVIYGMMSNVSIGALFLGGIVPGLVMAVLLMATVAFYAWRNKWGADMPWRITTILESLVELAIVAGSGVAMFYLQAATGWPVLVAALCVLGPLTILDWWLNFSAVMPLMTPMLLIGGMLTGLFTPTEAAVAACVWALFLGFVRYRSMTLKSFTKATFETLETTASVLFIVAAASIFGWLLTVTKVADALTIGILSVTTQKWVFLLLVNLLVLIVGSFIDSLAAITILVPILMPLLIKFGVDPVQFGVIMTLNLMIGLLHPPLGMVLYVLARISKLSVEQTTMAILPWLVPLMIALGLITFIPDIVLWLPHYLSGAK